MVTVNGIFGDDGLIAQANRGKEETEIAEAREQLSVVLSSAYIEKYKNPEYNEDEFLEEYIYEVNPDIEIEGEEISLNGHTFELDRSVPELGEYVGEAGNLPVKIRKVEVTDETDTTISVEVTTARAEGMKLRYSYKKVDEGEYTQAIEQEGNTYTFSGLEEKNRYNIKVELINGEEIVDTEEIEVDLGAEKFSEIYEETTKYTDSEGNTAWIPGGFAVGESEAINKISTGLVITDAINDNNSSIGNEFVWIPVGTYQTANGEKTNNLSRRTFTSTGATEINGDEAISTYFYGEGDSRSVAKDQIEGFKTSVTTHGGYYIGRYEAGTETQRTAVNDTLTTPLVQANKNAYGFVTRDQAKTQSDAMYSGNSYVTSELISSYAWDTALNFICQTNEEGYLLATTTDRIYGNIGTDRLELTGAYEADNYSNIHDILGNCMEWTTEYSSNNTYPCLHRGGFYYNSGYYAASRSMGITTESYLTYSFRLQLYVN